MKTKLSLVVTFLAVFTFSMVLPYTSVVTPPQVMAAKDAKKACEEQFPREMDACTRGYNGGYDGKQLEQICGIPGSPAEGLTSGPSGTYSICAAGYQFGVAQAKSDGTTAPKPTGDDLANRAKVACKDEYGDSGNKADACVRGYKAAYDEDATKGSVTAACNRESTEQLKTACRQGVKKANRNNIEITEPTPGAKQVVNNNNAAKKACEDADQTGGRLDACIDGYTSARNGVEKDDACKDYPATSQRRDACNKGWELGKDPEDQADCDMQLESILSWIACPVIDMGVNTTDWIFEHLIQPMLEDVPVSTNPNDGSYKAWQQFRIIGNVLLIGTMLAIVFSQLKGGGR